MVDVLVSADQIDVIGGRPRADVTLSSGSKGDRGSYILVGAGNPNDSATYIPIQTPRVYDMFINLSPDTVDYLYLFQYLNQDGVFQWIKLLRLVPNTFLDNYDGTFVDGKMSISIPILSIIPLASSGIYTASNFNVQHTLINSLPTASSIQIDGIDMETMVLNMTLTAAQLDGSTWEDVPDGPGLVHLIVTVV